MATIGTQDGNFDLAFPEGPERWDQIKRLQRAASLGILALPVQSPLDDTTKNLQELLSTPPEDLSQTQVASLEQLAKTGVNNARLVLSQNLLQVLQPADQLQLEQLQDQLGIFCLPSVSTFVQHEMERELKHTLIKKFGTTGSVVIKVAEEVGAEIAVEMVALDMQMSLPELLHLFSRTLPERIVRISRALEMGSQSQPIRTASRIPATTPSKVHFGGSSSLASQS